MSIKTQILYREFRKFCVIFGNLYEGVAYFTISYEGVAYFTSVRYRSQAWLGYGSLLKIERVGTGARQVRDTDIYHTLY